MMGVRKSVVEEARSAEGKTLGLAGVSLVRRRRVEEGTVSFTKAAKKLERKLTAWDRRHRNRRIPSKGTDLRSSCPSDGRGRFRWRRGGEIQKEARFQGRDRASLRTVERRE